MKKIHTIGKAALSLLLCCAMLSCAAFAAGPVKVYHLGDVTVTFGGEAPVIDPQANETVLLGGNFTFNSALEFAPIHTNPKNGSDLSLRIDNFGNTNIRVSYTIKVKGEPELHLSEQISPLACVYGNATSQSGGLECSVSIKVEPVNAGETGCAYVSVVQK